jgi:zinc-binding alcohol dehydrogenase family protein
MCAVGYQKCLPIDNSSALVDIELAEPEPRGRHLLVKVRAGSVNPVDTKVRKAVQPAAGAWKVLGWDAAGTIAAVGSEVARFKPGDAVFYAGALDRPGTNAEFHLVDERIVGRKPESLDWFEAAALPLTAITAWEALFDRLDIRRPVPGAGPADLIIGGAGGVGSIAIQLVRRLTDLIDRKTTVGARTRRSSRHRCQAASAPGGQARQRTAGFVLSTTNTGAHLPAIAELIAPQGRFAPVDDAPELNINPFKRKSVSVHWEFMFTRSIFETADIAEQGKLLDEVARLIDSGMLRTTLGASFGAINAKNLKRAHALIESRRAKGKISWKVLATRTAGAGFKLTVNPPSIVNTTP